MSILWNNEVLKGVKKLAGNEWAGETEVCGIEKKKYIFKAMVAILEI